MTKPIKWERKGRQVIPSCPRFFLNGEMLFSRYSFDLHQLSYTPGAMSQRISNNNSILFYVFCLQRAMSLYKKQNGVKAPQPATPVVSMEAEKDSPEARNEEISATADRALVDKMPSESSLPAGNMEEPRPAILDSAGSADGLGEEENGKTSDADGDHPTGMEEGKTDLITNADVLTKDSQDSEALVESTSVNSSRIPNSPESTH